MSRFFTNKEVARLLRRVEAAYIVKGGNRFKIAAYGRAADAVERAASEVKDFWDDGKLKEIPSIGERIGQYLDELFQTGQVKHFQEAFQGLPETMFRLLEVPGIGPKTAFRLTSEFKLNNPETLFEDLKKLADKHKICELEGFGSKSEQDILEGIIKYRQRLRMPERLLLHQALKIAEDYLDYLRGDRNIIKAEPLGSLRRRVSTVGDIDLAAAVKTSGQAPGVVERFVKYSEVVEVINKGGKKASVRLKSGVQVDLRVQGIRSFGSLLQYFTGSKHHNIALREYALSKGFSLSEYGIKPTAQNSKLYKFKSEEEFYGFLEMAWIPPELREHAGEIEAALKNQLPDLITVKDIKGDLQTHSSFETETSHDLGISSMKEMLERAEEIGYEYLAFSEHNPSSGNHTDAKILSILEKRFKAIEELKFSNKSVRVLNLLEVDILSDGSLPLPNGSEKFLEGIIVSIHSAMHHDRKRMTQRIIKGLSHPLARILAHPTGRLLNKREGYEADWKKIFEFCQKHDKAIEINAYPNRLDLPDTLARQALNLGVKLSLGTDAHCAEDLKMMPFGVSTARRGWAQKKDVINTWGYDRIIKWIRRGD